MIWKFMSLKIYISNLQNFAYFFMILIIIQAPGFLTLFYPLSIFGYAALEEKGPGRSYWYFVIFYT